MPGCLGRSGWCAEEEMAGVTAEENYCSDIMYGG